MNGKNCRKCGDVLTDDNWYSSHRKNTNYICIECFKLNRKKYRYDNIEKIRKDWRDSYYRLSGGSSSSDNKSCSNYLGIVIAESVLSGVFKNIEVMPPNNKGYDFICNGGKKIDVKSACKTKKDGWNFTINENETPDHFLLLAFDNRKDLNPIHLWLLPSNIINKKIIVGISESTVSKWDKYKLDINKVVDQCDIIRGYK